MFDGGYPTQSFNNQECDALVIIESGLLICTYSSLLQLQVGSLKYEASLAYYLQNNEMGKILDKISDKEARFMTESKVFCCRCTIKL